ncbi:MAG: DUF6512 family protein [Clostridium sp.]|nr:DUF6512 family protein [Clostridium sp.]
MAHIIYLWELFGVIFISIMGSLLHFTYEWSGKCKSLAVISAVNESTWEHLKIAFWPALIYSIFEYIPLSNMTDNFIVAKAVCLLSIPILIIILFYSYTYILGRNFLVIDIFIFILSIYIGQKTSASILTMPKLPSCLTSLSILIIVLLIVMFSLFTFFPPKLEIFRDSTNGKYGI